MSVRILIPPTLRKLCGGEEIIRVRPGTVREAIGQLNSQFNGIRDRLCDQRGQVRGSVLVYVNDEEIRFLDNQNTRLKAGDEVSLIPAFAGG
ncbi:MAG TPA: MoaD/ThiS family protein [Candidatus Limnocylindria bacterium]|jgi:molybdopterin synthase sulfur carrier subunit|nr:MoaD/ThiS family protein [Candidatus Limnocylindria bacterium]